MGPAGVTAAGLATAAMAYLTFAAPLLGRRRFQRLRAEVAIDPGARLRYYRRTVSRGWISAAIALAIGGLAVIEGFHIGLGPPRDSTAAWTAVVEIAVLIPVTVLAFRRWPRVYERMARTMLGGTTELLPATRAERTWFVGVALSAGIWEEIVYRGFVIDYVRWVAPHSSDAVLIGVSAALFGWAHVYQGGRGVAMTGLAGLLLATLALQTGGLLAPMIVHVLIDLRFSVLPALTSPPVPTAPPPHPPPPTPPEEGSPSPQ